MQDVQRQGQDRVTIYSGAIAKRGRAGCQFTQVQGRERQGRVTIYSGARQREAGQGDNLLRCKAERGRAG